MLMASMVVSKTTREGSNPSSPAEKISSIKLLTNK